ncbi:hypothetical protein GCM10027429_13630 [Marivirga atlantica]
MKTNRAFLLNYFPLEPPFEFEEPLELPPDLLGALLLPFPDGFPVVLGAFFIPLDFAIILYF